MVMGEALGEKSHGETATEVKRAQDVVDRDTVMAKQSQSTEGRMSNAMVIAKSQVVSESEPGVACRRRRRWYLEEVDRAKDGVKQSEKSGGLEAREGCAVCASLCSALADNNSLDQLGLFNTIVLSHADIGCPFESQSADLHCRFAESPRLLKRL